LGLLKNHKAIVEIAQAAGLTLANPKNPLLTTTYGVGELIDKAISLGSKEIIIALGGSATNDAGAGMAAALGTKFYDAKGKKFVPVGGTLINIAKIDDSATKEKLSGIKITVMCDVKNPLYGKDGAAYIYAKQKGADEKAIQKLDKGLRKIAAVIKKDLKKEVSAIPGGGAAGGLGAGCLAFLGGKLVSGIDVILDLSDFKDEVKNADLIVTGEGSFDTQSLMGKGIDGLLKRKPEATKLIVIAGKLKMDEKDYEKAGIYAAYETAPKGVTDFAEIKATAPACLFQTSKKAFSDWRFQTLRNL
jgi:glycerate kinase